MRLRRVKNASDILNNTDYVIKNPKLLKGSWQKAFNNANPIHIEVGMGKGQFILNMALNNPNINFIGIEKYDSILVRAIEKIDQQDIHNLKIICIDANELIEVFDQEINTIYLNFSDPWPKARHAKRRLTSEFFLNFYKQILINECEIVQKTDNKLLFESSVISFSNNSFKILDISVDLQSNEKNTYPTEYEEKFRKLKQPIYYLKVTNKDI